MAFMEVIEGRNGRNECPLTRGGTVVCGDAWARAVHGAGQGGRAVFPGRGASWRAPGSTRGRAAPGVGRSSAWAGASRSRRLARFLHVDGAVGCAGPGRPWRRG
jgi:hypothetical protein